MQTAVSHNQQHKPKQRTRRTVEPTSESTDADLVGKHSRVLCEQLIAPYNSMGNPLSAAAFNQSMQSFLAKQQSCQDSGAEDESDSDVDIDGVNEAAPKTGIQDIRALNSRLTKLALAHSIHLAQPDQLLLLLAVLDAIMQQGDSVLIGTNPQVKF